MRQSLFPSPRHFLKDAGLLLLAFLSAVPVLRAQPISRQLEARPADSLFFVGEALFDNYRYDSALPFFEELIFRLNNRKLHASDISFGIQACNCAGIIHMIYSHDEQAMQYFADASFWCDRIQDSLHKKIILNNTGVLYAKLQAYEQAYQAFKQAFSIANSGRGPHKEEILMNMLTMASWTTDTSTENFCLELLKQPEFKNTAIQNFGIHSSLSEQEYRNGHIEKSIAHIRQALRCWPLPADSIDFFSHQYLSLADRFEKCGKADSALYYYQKVAQMAYDRKNYTFLQNCLRQSIGIFQRQGKIASALATLDQYWNTTDSIVVQDRTLRLRNLEFATQKHLKDRELSDLRITTEYQNRLIKSKNRTLASLIAGGGLALLLLGIVYYQKKQQSKHLLLLYEKNSQLWKEAQQHQSQKNAFEKRLEELKIESKDTKVPSSGKEAKNAASNMTDTSRQDLLEKIIKVFEGDACLKNNFSLASLAKQVKSNTTYVSTTINEHYGKNFNTLVNECRIRQACQYLEDPEYSRYTIEYVAQSVGYANKTTFYAAFKKHTGLTPSQYQQLSAQQRKKPSS